MPDVSEIYKGYLDLIHYLEEVYAGGVVVWYISKDPYLIKNLLEVRPTARASSKSLIVPACEKFNALGSTQLKCTIELLAGRYD